MARVPKHFYRQSGVIAERKSNGKKRILLVTSRGGKRWVIPKGVVEEGLSPAESACKEAWEEGGVRGEVGTKPLGTYDYSKWGGTCTVEVFALKVDEILDEWPEGDRRERKWVDRREAAGEVREAGLREIILGETGRRSDR